MKAVLTAVVVALGISQGIAAAQSPVTAATPIKALMSRADFEAAGLDTLTPRQLDVLSAWVKDFHAPAEDMLVLGEDSNAIICGAIESEIDGDFDGWEGHTVFRLKNGQVWQQTSPSARYYFAHAPKVTIYPTPYRLKVEGMTGEISVRRLR